MTAADTEFCPLPGTRKDAGPKAGPARARALNWNSIVRSSAAPIRGRLQVWLTAFHDPAMP